MSTTTRKPRLTAAERRAIDKAYNLRSIENCESSIRKFENLRVTGDFTVVEKLMLFKLVLSIKEALGEHQKAVQ